MKKLIALLVALALLLSAVPALTATVTPLPPSIDMNRLSGRFIMTDIRSLGAGRAELTLYETEIFARDDILNLQPGDVLVSEGKEYPVETVTIDTQTDAFGWVILNEGTDSELFLMEYSAGDFTEFGSGDFALTGDNDAHPLAVAGVLTVELSPSLIFLDEIDPETGDILDLPALHSGEEFIEMLQTDSVGFDLYNTFVLYTGQSPFLVFRFYRPWQ